MEQGLFIIMILQTNLSLAPYHSHRMAILLLLALFLENLPFSMSLRLVDLFEDFVLIYFSFNIVHEKRDRKAIIHVFIFP